MILRFKQIFRHLRVFILHSRVALILFFEMLIGIISSVSLGIIFLKITREIAESDTQFLDVTISNFIYHLQTPALTKIMIFITNFGAGYILVGLMFIIIALLLRSHRKEALLFSIVSAMGLSINILLKNLIQRPRPTISPLVDATSYSFPSGHAMNSLVFYAMISVYLFHFTRSKILSIFLISFSVVLVFFIGFSRVYLGVHYPSDILGGYFIALWWLVTAFFIDKTIIFFELFKETKKS